MFEKTLLTVGGPPPYGVTPSQSQAASSAASISSSEMANAALPPNRRTRFAAVAARWCTGASIGRAQADAHDGPVTPALDERSFPKPAPRAPAEGRQ